MVVAPLFVKVQLAFNPLTEKPPREAVEQTFPAAVAVGAGVRLGAFVLVGVCVSVGGVLVVGVGLATVLAVGVGDGPGVGVRVLVGVRLKVGDGPRVFLSIGAWVEDGVAFPSPTPRGTVAVVSVDTSSLIGVPSMACRVSITAV